jgi:hypothetical protein
VHGDGKPIKQQLPSDHAAPPYHRTARSQLRRPQRRKKNQITSPRIQPGASHTIWSGRERDGAAVRMEDVDGKESYTVALGK